MYKYLSEINSVWGSPKIYDNRVFVLVQEGNANVKVERVINEALFNGKTTLINTGILASEFYFFDQVMMDCQLSETINFRSMPNFSLLMSISNCEVTRVEPSQHFIFLRDFLNNKSIDLFNIYTLSKNATLGENGSNFLMHNDLVFYCEFTKYPFVKKLHCFNMKLRAIVWEININDVLDIDSIEADERYFSRYLYAYENVLVIRIGNRFYIGLDTSTGNFIWKNTDLKTAELQDGKLYSIGTEFFCVVNALTGETEILKDCRAEFESNHQMTSSSEFTIDKNFLYIKAYKGIIGVFSIEKQSLIWSYNLNTLGKKVQFGANEKPVIAGTKLMILDLNNTLHVFEKEN